MKPTAKEISRLAGRTFQSVIPANWIYRPQEDQEDFGVDGEVELQSNGSATGLIFKVQIKGVVHVQFAQNGSIVTFSLRTARLRYYMGALELPMALIVVDVTSKLVYWQTLQISEQCRQALDHALTHNLKTATVHIPSEQQLGTGPDGLLNAVRGNMEWLRLHAVERLTAAVVSTIKATPPDQVESLLKDVGELQALLRHQQLDQLWGAENLQVLLTMASQILQGTTEAPKTRLSAAFYLEKVLIRTLTPDNPDFIDQIDALFTTLLPIVRPRSVEWSLKYSAICLKRSILLRRSVDQDFHAFISDNITQLDPLSNLVARMTRAQLGQRGADAIYKAVLLVHRLIVKERYAQLADYIIRIVPSIAVYRQRLEIEKLDEQAANITTLIDFLLDIRKRWALESNDAEKVLQTAIVLLGVSSRETLDSMHTQARTLVESIPDMDTRSQALRILESVRERRQSLAIGHEPTPEEEELFFRHHARTLGLDIDNPRDELSRLTAIGIRDNNPERVLRDCQHLMVFPTNAIGIPARMMGLLSAGPKYLRCLLHSFTVGGISLDDMYSGLGGPGPLSGFREEHCSQCGDRSPRGPGWKWTRQWNKAELKKHSEVWRQLVDGVDGTTI